ncbi:Low-density lipoprotein receptor- protein 6 [Desmophyllum pertusum]|uniref:Low-density lipoprotein receptor- protein 6 n=1 Tax=Desmophyllum pertusum TaxID=174260 RepID=A0A9W9YP07_9CNID|nr:Low-density lipoprotein receptor- protein 6 [Desmophyllum pertusum]
MCACPDGLTLLPDGKSCITNITRFLLFAEGSNIRQLALHYNSTSSLRIPLKTSSSTVIALDYNPKDNRVYWTDVSNGTISRAFLNGSSQETIVSTQLRKPYGLAVDPFGQNIYWTDSVEDVIEVASLNGAYRAVLIGNDLQVQEILSWMLPEDSCFGLTGDGTRG